ncbi:DUF4394 domain-containing protein [Hymenobacter sp. RP-2-7]|uniref:DUF4394 domain-containing protein n=1 Tax=Hymenobacter polaris TaxID=2682546 RepID=A0A7Y0FKV7_9BACT|nr:DUF4394 domain-containing protein [Hymenobacter polaris]NML64137.1 DUF4394 domain-containing protein [Hymenobacter polaris]
MPLSLRNRPGARRYGFWGLLGLLASATTLHAQTTPSTVYALGTTTQAYGGFAAGAQLLAQFNPATQAYTPNSLVAVAGVAAGQQLVGIDARPSTGQLFALGYAAASGAAQLYTLAVSSTAAVAIPVGTGFTLNLQDANRSNTYGFVTNVGFDFNPRVDRLRVVAPNGTNYRLNPNTGALVATDGTLTYAPGSSVGHAPYIGTAAYTNSVLSGLGTTLYDIDLTNTNGLLSTQAPPNDGVLNPVAPVTFAVNGATTYYPLASPTIALSLDIAYDRVAAQNLAFLLEARYSNDPAVADRYASNFYALDLTTGKATGKNLFGAIPVFLYDIAASVSLAKTWTGAVSTAWEDGGNWTGGTAPSATDDVFIPGTPANQPVVGSSAATKQALSVTLGNGAVLTTADGGVLSVYGNFVNNDGTVAGSGSGRIALVGTTRQEIAGGSASNFRNLSVGTAGAFTSADVSVEAGLTLTGNLTVTDQSFTLRSNATTGTAYVVNNGGTLLGTATVQRSIDGSLNGQGIGYRHYSAPVTNTTVGDIATATYTPVFNPAYNTSTTPDATTPFPTVYGYSQRMYESSPAVTITTDFDRGYFSPTATTPWVSGTGYSVNIPNNEVVDFVGTLANGNISTTPQGRSAKDNAGWQLLGNPYPSALDWDQVVSTGLAGLNNALFVYKSTGRYTGTYASYVNGQPANGGTNVVPLAQGFFVRTSMVGGQGSLNFQNSQRITSATTAPFQRTTADTRPQLLLELSNGTAAIQTDIYFERGATAAFDATFDAEALPTSNGLVLLSEAGANLLSINGQPELAGTSTVPLRVAVATSGTYTLGVANLANLPTGYHAYLRDATLNTYTDLATTPRVAVSLAAGPATSRFAVVFGTSAPLATAPAALAALVAVYPNPAHHAAVLLLPTSLRGQAASEVELLNALGQVVLRRTVAAGGSDQVELPLSSLAAGIYTVRATTSGGSVAKQLRVE